MASKSRRLDNGRYAKAYDEKITKEYLVQEYLQEERSPYMIAKDLGISPKTVYNYLDYYNIPRLKRKGSIEPGDKFKLLTTVKVVNKSKNGTLVWQCRCECGTLTNATTSQLNNGGIVSCGCYRKRRKNHRWLGYCGISGARVSEIRYRAKKKGWDFDLDAKFLWDLFIKQDKRCAITNESLDLEKQASLDRIDSEQGYIKGNVCWVTKDINKMKLDFSLSKFIELCELVVANKENLEW